MVYIFFSKKIVINVEKEDILGVVMFIIKAKYRYSKPYLIPELEVTFT